MQKSIKIVRIYANYVIVLDFIVVMSAFVNAIVKTVKVSLAGNKFNSI